MDKKIQRQWVKALRSGKYKQGRQHLRAYDMYCCLGVLCDLAVKAKVIDEPKLIEAQQYPLYAYGENNEMSYLPLEVISWADVNWHIQTALSNMNDAATPFEDIASYIEKEIK